jgi:uncharacterized protein
MLININSIKPGQINEVHGTLSETWVKETMQGLHITLKEYSFSLGIEKKGEFIEVEGVFKGQGTMECVRCAQEFTFPFNQKFRLFLYKEDDKLVGDGGEVELKTENLDFAMISGEEINLAEIIREQLILTLPDYPECNASCQGLCGNCGINLNKSICKCKVEKNVEKAENPFSALKDLKLKN